MPSKEDAKAQLRRDLTRIIDETRAEFEGKYGEELQALLGLSTDELEEIAPRLESTEVYAQLIAVVRNASAKNLSVARLRARIRTLGEVAVAIAEEGSRSGSAPRLRAQHARGVLESDPQSLHLDRTGLALLVVATCFAASDSVVAGAVAATRYSAYFSGLVAAVALVARDPRPIALVERRTEWTMAFVAAHGVHFATVSCGPWSSRTASCGASRSTSCSSSSRASA
jgi:hypothetical protein